jgi:hypothetical protein
LETLKIRNQEVSSELKGNTLRVYWQLIKSQNGVLGAREAQRLLNFSSPSLASYHLDKLIELSLAKKEHVLV